MSAKVAKAENFEQYGARRTEAAKGSAASFTMPEGYGLDIKRGCWFAKLTLIPDIACALNAGDVNATSIVPAVNRGRLWQFMASFGERGFTMADLWDFTHAHQLRFGPGVGLVDLFLMGEEYNFFEKLTVDGDEVYRPNFRVISPAKTR